MPTFQVSTKVDKEGVDLIGCITKHLIAEDTTQETLLFITCDKQPQGIESGRTPSVIPIEPSLHRSGIPTHTTSEALEPSIIVTITSLPNAHILYNPTLWLFPSTEYPKHRCIPCSCCWYWANQALKDWPGAGPAMSPARRCCTVRYQKKSSQPCKSSTWKRKQGWMDSGERMIMVMMMVIPLLQVNESELVFFRIKGT